MQHISISALIPTLRVSIVISFGLTVSTLVHKTKKKILEYQ